VESVARAKDEEAEDTLFKMIENDTIELQSNPKIGDDSG